MLFRSRSRYLAAYYRALISPAAMSSGAADRNSFRAAMNEVLKRNPEFAPAYVQLARSYFEEGLFDRAFAEALNAQRATPDRAGYFTLLAKIAHSLGRDENAATLARAAAERWIFSDRDEAVALWQALPAAVRTGAVPAATPLAPGVRTASGAVAEVICNEKEETTTVVLADSAGAFTGKNELLMGGFSDTLGFAGDHFNSCHRAKGMHAVIQYKTSPGSTVPGEMIRFDVRDPLLMP